MSNNSKVTEVTHGEYNGYPVISLPNGRRYGFTFGLKKASTVLVHAEAIQEFVETDGGPVADLNCRVGEYKGHPVISLFSAIKPNGSKHGFTFGLSKANTILQYIDDIRNFVANHS